MKRTATLADEFILAYLLSLNQVTELRLRRGTASATSDRETLLSRRRAAEQSQRVLESLVLPHLEQFA
jgi:hypothetical protein